MKKKSSRLAPVEKLADDKAKSAAADMVSARNNHETQELKLNDLMNYRLEYIEQFQSRAKNGMPSSQLQQYQLFISQLDVAIKQQTISVGQASDALDTKQDHWRDKHTHKKAINKVVRRFKVQEHKAVAKSEQADLDEHNTRSHNHKKNSD